MSIDIWKYIFQRAIKIIITYPDFIIGVFYHLLLLCFFIKRFINNVTGCTEFAIASIPWNRVDRVIRSNIIRFKYSFR